MVLVALVDWVRYTAYIPACGAAREGGGMGIVSLWRGRGLMEGRYSVLKMDGGQGRRGGGERCNSEHGEQLAGCAGHDSGVISFYI